MRFALPSDHLPVTEQRRLKRLRSGFWGLAVLLGLLQAWTARDSIDSDGVSYLDLGDAFFGGDFSSAINAVWSPLYPLLLGGVNYLVHPSYRWEFPLAHAVNFVIYLASLACFDFFLWELIRYHKRRRVGLKEQSLTTFPDWCWLATGYPLLIWSSLDLIGLDNVKPDLCVATCLYLVAALLLRVRQNSESSREWIVLGAVLGLGFLAKAAMLQIGFAFLGTALWESRQRKGGPRYVLIAFASFILVSGPFIFALSRSLHRLSFGESARLNYAWYVNGTVQRHWQGGNDEEGTAVHPTRKIRQWPPIYEFGSPVEGTYPVWGDPAYWNEGLRIRFDLMRQLAVIRQHVSLLAGMLFALHGMLIISPLLLFYMSDRRWLMLQDLREQAWLWGPALFGIGMFSLVHVEDRYVAPLIVLTFLAVLSSVKLKESLDSKRLFSGLTIAFLAMWAISTGPVTTWRNLRLMLSEIRSQNLPEDLNCQVVEGLRQLGIEPGSKVASLEYSNPANAIWARLAKVRIVAEICPTMQIDASGRFFLNGLPVSLSDGGRDIFWSQNPSVQTQAIEDFEKTGAEAIVAFQVPAEAQSMGWRRIGDTDYFAYLLGGRPAS